MIVPRKSSLLFCTAVLALAACEAESPPDSPEKTALTTIELDGDDVAGVVRSADGPEAGVWVIAETDAFDTRFARIVTTDEQGRYLVPDLPQAT